MEIDTEKSDDVIDKVIEKIDQLIDRTEKPPHQKHFVQSLVSTKVKKILNRKKPLTQKKTLTRKEFAGLGLYSLPRNATKYSDIIPLNQLWEQYFVSHMGMDSPNFKPPQPDESTFTNFMTTLMKCDFHGANIKVVRSKCPSVVHQEGLVMLDTKQTFVIVGMDNRTRTIPKCDSVFQIKCKNLEMIIYGKNFNVRSAERSVKKIKTPMHLDL